MIVGPVAAFSHLTDDVPVLSNIHRHYVYGFQVTNALDIMHDTNTPMLEGSLKLLRL